MGDDRGPGETPLGSLLGDTGNGRLDAGKGTHVLAFGLGPDILLFGASSGDDRFTDFTTGHDLLLRVDGVMLPSQVARDVKRDGVVATLLTLIHGGCLGPLGVSGLSSMDLPGQPDTVPVAFPELRDRSDMTRDHPATGLAHLPLTQGITPGLNPFP